MFDIWVNQRMQFTDEDRREALESAGAIIELALLARTSGVLFLDNRIEIYKDTLLKKGLRMAVDMVHADNIKEILQNYIIAGDYRGGALLRRIIIMEGIICLVNGEHPKLVYEILASRFGEDFFLEYEVYCKPILDL